jgi:SAM-dependent methyltransferase
MISLAKHLMRSLHAPVYAHREEVLVGLIGSQLRPGFRVLDVGCGFGHLGRAIMRQYPDVTVEGVERVKRPGEELIPVHAYDGPRLPWNEGAFDLVIVADVLHHDLDPHRLLGECIRISNRLVLVKDHLREGFLAQPRIALLDWAANVGYGVPCTFRYNNLAQWRSAFRQFPVKLAAERASIDIYPPVVNTVFGGGLHYFAVLEKCQ